MRNGTKTYTYLTYNIVVFFILSSECVLENKKSGFSGNYTWREIMSFLKNPDNGFIQVDGLIVPQQLLRDISKISTDNVSKSNVEKQLFKKKKKKLCAILHSGTNILFPFSPLPRFVNVVRC